MADSRF